MVLLNNEADYDVSHVQSSAYSITLKFGKDNNEWLYTSVYASPIPVRRIDLWNHLKDMHIDYSLPWVVIGDFSEVLLPSYQIRRSFLHSRALVVSNILNDL